MPDTPVSPFDSALAAWANHLEAERGCAPSTVALYRRDVRRFLTHLLLEEGDEEHGLATLPGDLPSVHVVGDIARSHVVAYVKHRRYHDRISVPTIVGQLASVHRFFAYLIDAGDIVANPAAGILPSKILATPAARRSLSDEEVDQLLSGIRGDRWLDVRDRAIIITLVSTGLHVSELVDLDITDLTTSGTLHAGDGDAARVLPLDEMAVEALHDWLGVRETLGEPGDNGLFISSHVPRTRVSTRQVQNLVRKRADAAELEDINTQALRHTFARRLYERGLNRQEVRKLLGIDRPVQSSAYGVAWEPRGSGHCAVCGVEIDHRSTMCRSHAMQRTWAKPGFREKWREARYGKPDDQQGDT